MPAACRREGGWLRTGLGIGEVFALMAQPPGQLVHHLLEDDAVHVLAQHVEEEPVAHLALLDEGVDHLPLDEPEPDVEQVGTHPRRHNYH
jgi:hypothetical protein